MKVNSNNKRIIIVLMISLLIINSTYAYKVDTPNETVHQYITQEAKEVWSTIPSEIDSHLTQSISEPINGEYDLGDDIITGSGEEDKDLLESTRFFNRNHFWQPDNPIGYGLQYYDRGLWDTGGTPIESSYTKALRYWNTRVIPYYQDGDIDEAYYWLGRVAHLLEDATVPAHMHLDPHPFFDSLENYDKVEMTFGGKS